MAATHSPRLWPDKAKELRPLLTLVTGFARRPRRLQGPDGPSSCSRRKISRTRSPSNNIADFVNQLPATRGLDRACQLAPQHLERLGGDQRAQYAQPRRKPRPRPRRRTSFGRFDDLRLGRHQHDPASWSIGSRSSPAARRRPMARTRSAGVVNFILNKKMEGLRISGDIGVTDKGDGFNYSGSIAGGMSFADGRGHAIFNAEIAHQDGIFEINDPNDRPWNHKGYLAFANPAYAQVTASLPSSPSPRTRARRTRRQAASSPVRPAPSQTRCAAAISASMVRSIHSTMALSIRPRWAVPLR
jgi:iron complex outermembrane receptor protein